MARNLGPKDVCSKVWELIHLTFWLFASLNALLQLTYGWKTKPRPQSTYCRTLPSATTSLFLRGSKVILESCGTLTAALR